MKGAKRENESFFINERDGARYIKCFVSANEVYMLARVYRCNKLNPNFVQMFATVRRADQDDTLPYYFMSYHWNGEDDVSKKSLLEAMEMLQSFILVAIHGKI